MAAEYYVSPNGSSGASGTINSPWDLRTALAQPAAVRPGDTIWLRGGTYRGMFTSNLKGAQGSPIVVRQYPGERAIIDGAAGNATPAVLTVNGYWTWYWGFEVMNSYSARYLGSSGSDGRATGIDVFGANTKFINLYVHDNGNGFGFWNGADNSEIYGSLIYNNGWDAPDRGHGHSIYSQNQNGTKRIVDNIYFNAFSHGIHIYGSGNSYLDNYYIDGNIAFNNGILSWYGVTRNFLIGGGIVARNYSVLNNYTYFNPGLGGDNGGGMNTLGYGSGCANLTAQGNYFHAPNAMILSCSGVTMNGNTFSGKVSGFSSSQYPGNTYHTSRPSGTKVFVRPNQYEGGRGHVAVYNWDRQSSVPVDLSGVLKVGDSYEIRDAQNYFDAPVLTGTHSGGAVNVPMILSRVAATVGSATVAPVHTPVEFGTFVVVKTGQGSAGNPVNQAPVVSAGGGQTITLPASATLSGKATDDGLPSNALSVAWSKVSGPGSVSFGNAASVATTASFSAAGSYVLRLTASDGALSSNADTPITVNAQPSSGGTAGVFVNAGAGSYKDPQGQTWSADTSFNGGATYSTGSTISGTTSSPLYQTVRYGPHSYDFTVAPGTYTVTLKFAEVYFTAPGQRVFNVAINGQTVLSKFDVVAQAGGGRIALDKQFDVNAANGRINIQFIAVTENPMVSAIAILPKGGTQPTPIAVSVNPAGVTLSAGQSTQFAASVSGTSNTAVYWSVNPAAGIVSANGVYTAPPVLTTDQTVTVKATSAADSTKTATATVTLKAPAPTFAGIRVNAGGSSYVDPQGRIWSADTGFSGGATYSGAAVSGTTTSPLYQTQRFGQHSYTFSVPNGTRTVTLKFAEVYFTSPGSRVFNVAINGQPVLTNFDVTSQAGPRIALDKQFPVSVTNGQITIQLNAVVENPMISAIEIQ